MEFSGQRGDSVSPWSVGKYAKRSATIHLNSKDVMERSKNNHVAHVVGQNTDGLFFDDPSGVVRDSFQTAGNTFTATLDQDGLSTVVGGVELRAAAGGRSAGFFGDDDTFTNLTQLKNAAKDATLYNTTITAPEGMPVLADALSGYATDGGALLTTDAVRTFVTGLDASQLLNSKNAAGKFHGTAYMTPAGVDVGLNVDPNQYVLNLPMRSFTDGHTTELLEYAEDPTALGGKTDDSEWLAEANKGWVVELFYSANATVVDGETGVVTSNAARTQKLIFVGTAHFRTTYLDRGVPFVVCTLNKSPNLDLMFSDGEYAALKIPARVYNRVAGTSAMVDDIGLSFSNGLVAGVDDTAASGVKQIRWQLRKMPSLTLTPDNVWPRGQSHADYEVHIPNIIGYPEHKRCLIQVQSVSMFPTDEFGSAHISQSTRPDKLNQVSPVYVGVELGGVGPQNMFSTRSGALANEAFVGMFCLDAKGVNRESVMSYGFDNSRAILDDGVLCSSPFGKSVRVMFTNLTSKQALNTNVDESGAGRAETEPESLINNPTHLTLRLLFLDDDDLPMR